MDEWTDGRVDGRIWLCRNVLLSYSLPETSSASFLLVGSMGHKYKLMWLPRFASVSPGKQGAQHVRANSTFGAYFMPVKKTLCTSSLPSPKPLWKWAKSQLFTHKTWAPSRSRWRESTQDVCWNDRVGMRAAESSHPRHPPPGLLTICIASSIHFSVSSADTENPPPGAGVDSPFTSIPHWGPRSSAPEAAAAGERRPRNAAGAGRRFRGGSRTARHSGANSGRTGTPGTSERRRRRGGSNRKRSCSAVIHAPFPLRWQSLRKVAFVISGEHQAGQRRSCRVVQARWQRNGFLVNQSPTPWLPAPPGPEDAEIYVEFSETSQKEMYLLGHGPRRWVTGFLEGGIGRSGRERGVYHPK